MSYSVPPLARLVEQLERLPGIGHKSAQRLAFFILELPDEAAGILSRPSPRPGRSSMSARSAAI